MYLQISCTSSFISTDKEKIIVGEIKEKGYSIVENAFTKEWCLQAANEVDYNLNLYKDKIWKDGLDSDNRVFGIDRLSKLIESYYKDEFIRRVLETYEGTKVKDGFTLGAKLVHTSGNKGSGGGWHRDHANIKQSKSILYLTDVNTEQGPFQYIEGSHTPLQIFKDTRKYKLEPFKSRFADDDVERLIEAEPKRLKTFEAKAGTLILADTRGIHRGLPIERDERYALTNYYWYHSRVPKHISKFLIK